MLLYFKLNSREGVGVTFCLRSLVSKGGTFKTVNALGEVSSQMIHFS